ncbi:MAG: regulatory iron-sulfur-containing complex subunit RicT [Pseudomonadota bacterium]|nr:regulatory iron-sulfur-containing complex subunit RicT [Pseudomonadota bacterium]
MSSNIVGVQFKHAGRIFYLALREQMSVVIGDKLVVDTDRGFNLAEVVNFKPNAKPSTSKAAKKIIRKATPNDLQSSDINIDDIHKHVQGQAKELNLAMTVLKVETVLSNNKVMVYFSSSGRVDFRELVKRLASDLRLRVELKQVGPRNETKLMGGIGVCGREYCCSSFLREFLPVSTRMAKNQNLALNPTKISGGCGRLLCCLHYENETYSEQRAKLPKRGTAVSIAAEEVTVIKVDLLNEMLLVEDKDGNRSTVKASEVSATKKSSSTTVDEEEWGEDLDLEDLME